MAKNLKRKSEQIAGPASKKRRNELIPTEKGSVDYGNIDITVIIIYQFFELLFSAQLKFNFSM